MKTIFKNFIHSIKRFKVSSVINILGMTVAFASFSIILMLVNHEYSFDKYHSKAQNIYRVDNVNQETGNMFSVIHPRALIESVIQSSPNIKAGTLLSSPFGSTHLLIEENGSQIGIKEDIVFCHADITHIFDFHMIEGDIDCLKSPENVLIPESIAKRLFGNKSALGKQFILTDQHWLKPNQEHLIIGGIFKDLPENTQLNNNIYTTIDNTVFANNWSSSNFLCYVLLNDKISPEEVATNFNKHIDLKNEKENNIGIKLTPLTDIYYLNEFDENLMMKNGDMANSILMLTIAFVIILITIINFTNFSMALAPLRLKPITTRKVFGCQEHTLRAEIIGEAILIALLAFFLSILLLFTISSSHLFSFTHVDINPINNMRPIMLSCIIAIITGLIAGVRPAFYISSFPPALALKGTMGTSPKGKRLRLFLVSFQFIISLILIISTLFIYQQNQFIKNFKLGYDTEQTIVTGLNGNTIGKNKNAYISRFKENTDITDVAFSTEKLGASDHYRTWSIKFKDEEISFNSLGISWNFPTTMDIQVVEGRAFSEVDGSTSCLIPKAVSEKYKIEVGDFLNIGYADKDIQVIGIVDDIKFTSLHSKSKDANLLLIIDDYNERPISYVKVKANADYSQVISHIQNVVSELDPAYPVSIEFYDQLLNLLYKKEESIAKSIFLFSIIAILISIMGVFGLVLFENQYRRKEIGVRKVFGSSEMQILRLLNTIYMKIFFISFLIAIPFVVIFINHWLENFAYKTPIHWWMFLLGGLPVLLLVVVTVTAQSYQVATANPVDSLKAK